MYFGTPPIVKEGLVTYLDSGNYLSFTGSITGSFIERTEIVTFISSSSIVLIVSESISESFETVFSESFIYTTVSEAIGFEEVENIIGFITSSSVIGTTTEVTSYTVTNNGTSYVFNGTASNPTIPLIRGTEYSFTVSSSDHPFWIKTLPTTASVVSNYFVRSEEFDLVWTPISASVTADQETSPDSDLTADLLLASTSSEAQTFTVVNNGASAYTIDGNDNPTLTLERGRTYDFDINASGHPFFIMTGSGAWSADGQYNDGVSGQGTEVGTLSFTVPLTAPSTLAYVCQNHSGMNGTINIIANTSSLEEHYIYQSISNLVLGDEYVFSVYGKFYNKQWIALKTNTGAQAWFDLANGVTGSFTGSSVSISDEGSGWYRAALFFTSSVDGALNQQIHLADSDGDLSYAGITTSGSYIWGAHFNTGSTLTPYVQNEATLPNTASNSYDDGVSANGVAQDIIIWTVTSSAPSTLYYISEYSESLQGQFSITDGPFVGEDIISESYEPIISTSLDPIISFSISESVIQTPIVVSQSTVISTVTESLVEFLVPSSSISESTTLVTASFLDLSGNGISGSFILNPVYEDEKGGYFQFNGNSSTVTIPHNTSSYDFTDNVTVGGWVKINSFVTPKAFLSKYIPGVGGLEFGIEIDQKIHLQGETNLESFDITSSADAVVDTWYNVVGVKDGSTLILYVNGLRSTEYTLESGSGTIANTGSISLASRASEELFFGGSVANFFLYNRVLNDSEILQNYKSLVTRYF